MDALEASFAKWILSHRGLVIVLALIGVLAGSYGVTKLYFDSSYRVFFGKDNPQLLAFEALENTYTKNDNVIIVIAPEDGQVFTRETLAGVEELTKAAWQVPYSNRVDSITNFQYTAAIDDDLIVRDMVKDALSLSDEAIERVRQLVFAEPALYRRLISDRGHVTAINVTTQIPVELLNEASPEVVGFVRDMVAEFQQRHPDIDIYLTGMVVMNNTFFESAMNDMSSLIPISFGLMLLILAVLVGGFFGTLVSLMVIAFSITTAMGIGGHLGYPLTSPTSGAPVIILTVAIANCVHLLVTFFYGMRHGETRIAAMEESLRINLQPVFLASITTAIGFLTLNFSEVPPFGQLGNMVASGVLVSFVLAVTFLPAVMTLLPVRAPQRKELDTSMMERLAEFVIGRRRVLLWGMTIAIVLMIVNIPRNELNDVFIHYFGKSITFRTDTDFTLDNLTGVYVIHYSLESGESGGINNPPFLRDVERFAQWLASQPEIVHVDRFTNVMKRLNKNMHGDDEAYYRLPEDRDLAAQYLLLYEMALPYGLDLNNQVNVDKSSTKVSATMNLVSSNGQLAFDERALAWVNENAPGVESVQSAGTNLMFSNIGQRNISAMLAGTTVALVLISMILMLALRSMKLGFLSLIPNLVPAAMAFGLWGIFVGQVGLALSLVTSMTLGIVVDYTVHFLSKYLRARREKGLPPPDAVRYAFRTVGHALFVTTVVLVAGFLVLATSSFELNSGMGLLSAIVISLALLTAFFLLPPLLMKIEGDDDDVTMVASDSDRAASA
ncbi:MAG: MMPL family transporter [Gammaproteobacteria bacterium]